jgi:hypothetical protein
MLVFSGWTWVIGTVHVAVIDIGKPGKNLGWAIVGHSPEQGTDIDDCIKALANRLSSGPLALGFEAPMFVPKRVDPLSLTKARKGECVGGVNRPFSAGAGASVIVTALVVVPYVLSGLKRLCPNASAHLDWHRKLARPNELLLFEAFVTDQPKERSHPQCDMEDAKLAAETAFRGLADTANFQSSIDEPECLSLLAAMMVRTDWGGDLKQPCLVVRASVT